jgi:hypothetical protein
MVGDPVVMAVAVIVAAVVVVEAAEDMEDPALQEVVIDPNSIIFF